MLARADSVSGTSHYYVRVPAGAVLTHYIGITASYVSNTWKIYWYKKNDLSTLQEQTIIFNNQYTSSTTNSSNDAYSSAGYTIEIDPDTDYIVGIADASSRNYGTSWLARFGTSYAYMNAGTAEASYVKNIRQIINIDTSATMYWEDANITYDTSYGPTGSFLAERFAFWTNLEKIVDHQNTYIEMTSRSQAVSNYGYVPTSPSTGFIMYRTFYNCASLSYVRLPKIKLYGVMTRFFERLCFAYTFYNCTSLTETVSLLPDPTEDDSYYPTWVGSYFEYCMYQGCTSLTTTHDKFGYGVFKYMPLSGWTSSFYDASFYNHAAYYYKGYKYRYCNSLLEPEPEASTIPIDGGAYLYTGQNITGFAYGMYYGCTSLQYAAAEGTITNPTSKVTGITLKDFKQIQYQGCISLEYCAGQLADFTVYSNISFTVGSSFRRNQFCNCNKMKFTVSGLGVTPLRLTDMMQYVLTQGMSSGQPNTYNLYEMFYLDSSHQVNNGDSTPLYATASQTVSQYYSGYPTFSGTNGSYPGNRILGGHDNMSDYASLPTYFKTGV